MKPAISGAIAIILMMGGCGSNTLPYRVWLGSWGGTLEGPDGTSLTIPAKALTDQAEIYILKNDQATDLPDKTITVYDVGTTGLKLNVPAIFAVPTALCNPSKWSLHGTAPWLNLKNADCPSGFTCAELTVLGTIACTKVDK